MLKYILKIDIFTGLIYNYLQWGILYLTVVVTIGGTSWQIEKRRT